MPRSIRFIHGSVEVVALLSTALVVLASGIGARSALRSHFVATEAEELKRSAFFLENQLDDRLAFFKAYADDVLAGQQVTPPPGFESLALVDARSISVSKVLPGPGSSSLFPGYYLGAQASGRFYGSLAPGELGHSGVVRVPELDAPSVYYAYRQGDLIVSGRGGTGFIRQTLKRAADIAGGAYLIASIDGFILVSSLDQTVPFSRIDPDHTGLRRLAGWFVSVLDAPALGGRLVRLTEPTRMDRLMNRVLFIFVPATLVMALFAVLTFLIGYSYIVRPLERLVAALPDWPDLPVDAVKATMMPREIEALFLAFGSSGARILSTVAELSRARAELVKANEDLESRVLERTAQLALANDQILAQEKMAALGRLAAGVAHELNTPLAAISASLEQVNRVIDNELPGWFHRVLRLDPDDLALLGLLLSSRRDPFLEFGPRFREKVAGLRAFLKDRDVRNARNKATVLAELGLDVTNGLVATLVGHANMEELLDLARTMATLSQSVAVATEGALRAARVVTALRSYTWESEKPQASPVDIGVQLHSALVLLGDRLNRGITVLADCPEGLLVNGDPDRLMQVWLNLLSNAIQSMGVKGSLAISLVREEPWVKISIADTGPGIPPEIQDKIFQPFFTTKPRGEGTGLGLDICRKVLEAIGGSIAFSSEPGHTVFMVLLPEASQDD